MPDEGIIALVIGGLATAANGILMLRPRKADVYSNSAVALSEAYAKLIDRHEKDLARQQEEISQMRREFADYRTSKEAEVAALRLELAGERSARLALEAEVRALRKP